MSRHTKIIPPQIIEKFGSEILNETGDELLYRCPFCEEVKGTPDLKGNLYVNKSNLFYFCQRCNSKGYVGESVKGYRFDNNPSNPELENLLTDVLYPNHTIDYSYEIPKLRPLVGTESYDYLISRGFTDELIKFYDIRVGSIVSKYRHRIIIPNRVIRTSDNRDFTDMFVARYYRKIPKDENGKDTIPKYLNPYGDVRRKVVFNLHRISKHEPIIISEGCITAISAGINAVATYGKYVTDTQLYQILEKEPSAIYVGLDPDAYNLGIALCERIQKLSSVPIYIIRMSPDDGDHADANSVGHFKYMEYVKNAVPYNELALKIFDILKT